MSRRVNILSKRKVDSMAFRRYKGSEPEYVKMRTLFYKKVNAYFENSTFRDHKELTQEELYNIIKNIKIGEVLKKNGATLSSSQCNNMKKYEVIRNPKGNEILILRRSQFGDPPVKVAASEYIFDLILYAHLDSSHGSRIQIVQELCSKFEIPKIYYDIFSLDMLCPECYKANTHIPQVFGDCGLVEIINMIPNSDERFNCILYYFDKATNYTLLRPLILGNETEIAMELLRIFLDFGAPKILQCVNVEFFIRVMQSVSKAYPSFNVVVAAMDIQPNVSAKEIMELVQAWKRNTSCNAWSTGIYMIQWELNNSSRANVTTPYSEVFHHNNITPRGFNEMELEVFRPDTPVKILDINSNENVNRIEQQEAAKEISLSQNNCKANPILTDKMDKILEEQRVQVMTASVPTLHLGGQNNPNTIEQQVKEVPESELSQLHTEEDLGIVIKSEEGLEELPTIPTKRRDSPPIVLNVTDNPEGTLIKLESVEEISVINNDAAENTQSQTSASKTCHVCHKTVLKSFTCDKCKNGVHLYCTLRHVVSGVNSNNSNLVLSIVCLSCCI